MALHIPGPDDPRSPSQILNQVHQQLYQRYAQSQMTQEKSADAAFLQEFLQAWKLFANGAADLNSNIFTVDLMQQIKERFPSHIHNLFKFKNTTGKTFEEQFTKFIYALLQGTGTGIDTQMDRFLAQANVGTRKADSVFGQLDTTILDDLKESIIKSMVTEVDKKLQEEYTKARQRVQALSSGHFNLDVNTAQVSQGKIDIDASKASVTWNFTAFDLNNSVEVQRAIRLLANAKITAKNYSTDWFIANKLRKEKWGWSEVASHSLHFGQTNLYIILLMVLGQLGYTQDLIASVYYASIATEDPDALRHFYHIRAVYEITGFGQTLVGDEYKELQEADFLIWNDPSGVNITVRSTAELIARIFNDAFEENRHEDMLSRSITLDYNAL